VPCSNPPPLSPPPPHPQPSHRPLSHPPTLSHSLPLTILITLSNAPPHSPTLTTLSHTLLPGAPAGAPSCPSWGAWWRASWGSLGLSGFLFFLLVMLACSGAFLVKAGFAPRVYFDSPARITTENLMAGALVCIIL